MICSEGQRGQRRGDEGDDVLLTARGSQADSATHSAAQPGTWDQLPGDGKESEFGSRQIDFKRL